MNKEIANDAHRAANHLLEDLDNKNSTNHSTDRFQDEVIAEYNKLKPAEFREYMNGINRELSHSLPAISFTGVEVKEGRPVVKAHDNVADLFADFEIGDNSGSRIKRTAFALRQFEYDKADGTHVSFDGRERHTTKSGPHGEYYSKRETSDPKQTEIVTTKADGTQITNRGDGSRTVYVNRKDGTWEGYGTGPEPKQNFESVKHRDGHVTTMFKDGTTVGYTGER